MTVVHRDGTELGTIDSMLETGANDVMVVIGETERLIPFAMNEVVIKVDLQQRRVDVDWEWD
jgi:16S rRNA processing protein RimM